MALKCDSSNSPFCILLSLRKKIPIWTKLDFWLVIWASRSIEKIKTLIHCIFQRHIHWDFTQMDIKRYLQEKGLSFTCTPTRSKNFTMTPPRLTDGSWLADNPLTKSIHYSSVQLQIISSTYVCKVKRYIPDIYSRETCLVSTKEYIQIHFYARKKLIICSSFSPIVHPG